MSNVVFIETPNQNVRTAGPCSEFASSRHCNVCLALYADDLSYKMPVNLLKCNGCRLVQYCTAKHQLIDWPFHRDFCRAVKQICTSYKINNVYNINGKPLANKTDLTQTVMQVKFLLRCILKRKLHFHEEEFVTFPNCCAFCFSFSNVTVADCCRGVAYCSKEHKLADSKKHLEICGQLRLYYCIYRLLKWPNDFDVEFHKRLDSLLNTDTYEIYETCSNGYIPKVPVASPDDYLQFAAMSELSYIASICYGLQYVKMDENKCETVTIFVVGATYEMDMDFKIWQTRFFFTQYPAIKVLHIHFIGPEVNSNISRRLSYSFMNIKREVTCYSHGSYFENFTQNIKIKPTLIICYNCGFSEFPTLGLQNSENSENAIKSNSWLKAIDEMLNFFDTPILFTSYTKNEADLDYGVVLHVANSKHGSFGIERIFMLGKNPFKDFRPIRNCNLDDEEEFYYRNNYIQGIRSFLR